MIGNEIGIVVEFATIVFVPGMAERTVPMTTYDDFTRLDDACMSSLDAVDPAGFVPHDLISIAPICNRNMLHLITGDTDRGTGNPTVGKNVVVSFVIIYAGKDALPLYASTGADGLSAGFRDTSPLRSLRIFAISPLRSRRSWVHSCLCAKHKTVLLQR